MLQAERRKEFIGLWAILFTTVLKHDTYIQHKHEHSTVFTKFQT